MDRDPISPTPCCAASGAMASISIRHFPYTSYQRMTLDDVRDLFAFLKTLPAESDAVGAACNWPFPSTCAADSGCGSCCIWMARRSRRTPPRVPQINRGAYLVEGPGHCAECHSPRNVFGGIISGSGLRAASTPRARDGCPTSRPMRDGIADLVRARHGVLAGKRTDARLAPPSASTMSDVVLQYRQADARGSGSDGGLPQVSAAPRRQAATEKVSAIPGRRPWNLLFAAADVIEPMRCRNAALFCPIAAAVVKFEAILALGGVM